MADVAEIAESLTLEQRELLLSMSGAWKLVTVDEVRPLNKLGLTAGRWTSFGGYAARLLAPGEAVSDYLANQSESV